MYFRLSPSLLGGNKGKKKKKGNNPKPPHVVYFCNIQIIVSLMNDTIHSVLQKLSFSQSKIPKDSPQNI